MRWVIYALGGGWGHLVRSLALARSTPHPVTILCNSPYASYIPQSFLQASNCTLAAIATEPLPDETQEQTAQRLRQQIQQFLLQQPMDCLVVDTFPRGLGGELAEVLPVLADIPKVLVHRDINPEYVREKQLLPFVATNFDLVLIPGEGKALPFEYLPQTDRTAPWLIRNANELPDRPTARTLVRAESSTLHPPPLILICAAGREEELALYGQVAGELARGEFTVRCLSAICPPYCPPELWVSHFPAMECLPAADVAIGGGGYNTLNECVAVGVPLVAIAFPRLYDRQKLRALRYQRIHPIRLGKNIPEILPAVKALLSVPRSAKLSTQGFENGAIAAARHITTLVESLRSLH